MDRIIKLVIISLLISIFIASCGINAAPTESPEMIYTRVAETIQANMSQTALAMPTATSTSTLSPSPTMTSTIPPLPTISSQSTALVLPTLQTINTPANIPTSVAYNIPGDHARFLYNQPSDGFSIKYNSEFPIVFALENTGTTTWNTSYSLKFYGGKKCWDITSVNLPSTVTPGKRIEVFVDCFAPEIPGNYYNRWALYTDTGVYVQGSEMFLYFTSTP